MEGAIFFLPPSNTSSQIHDTASNHTSSSASSTHLYGGLTDGQWWGYSWAVGVTIAIFVGMGIFILYRLYVLSHTSEDKGERGAVRACCPCLYDCLYGRKSGPRKRRASGGDPFDGITFSL